ncbi:unnamed protein product [marine sediment metagenome]|uniref:Aminoglycoside phosphotransferase domain-containing protein n=1 Tax=marine sediment metagenome TaxID=412755 RepID=X0T871_9ZZZZ
MVIFDLEDTLIAPRFLDIAVWLGAPDNLERRYADRRTVSDEYLRRYNARKDTSVSVDEFLSEVHDLWIAWQFDRVHWCMDELGDRPSDIGSEPPVEYRKTVSNRLAKTLGVLLSESGA